MAEELVMLEDMKRHLNVEGLTEHDAKIQMYLDAAHEVVLDYVKNRVSNASTWEATVDAWTDDTVPKRVKAAIMRQCADLFRFRGDDDGDEPKRELGYLAPGVTALLYRLRDPALA